MCFQVVDVPVEPAGNLAMTCYPGLQASRAEGAADIDIIAGFELKVAELTDRQQFFPGCREDHRVCAGERVHDEALSHRIQCWVRETFTVSMRKHRIVENPKFEYRPIV